MRLEAPLSFERLQIGRVKGVAGDIDVFEVLGGASPGEVERPVDIVCGMELAPDDSTVRLKLHGRDFYFCSEKCLAPFAASPSRYTH